MGKQVLNEKLCIMCKKMQKEDIRNEFSGLVLHTIFKCHKRIMENPYYYACDEIELKDKYNKQ